jgi:hypothetical protein
MSSISSRLLIFALFGLLGNVAITAAGLVQIRQTVAQSEIARSAARLRTTLSDLLFLYTSS